MFTLKWNFKEDRCINSKCKSGPGSEGCMKVGSTFERESEELGRTRIQVQHSNKLEDRLEDLTQSIYRN